MLFSDTPTQQTPLEAAITQATHQDETQCVEALIDAAQLPAPLLSKINRQAIEFVTKMREVQGSSSGLDTFLSTYDLSTEEGIAMMCLAEAMLRIPDKATMDDLIRDKIASGDWQAAQQSDSFYVNAATWGLMLTGKVFASESPEEQRRTIKKALKKVLSRASEPVIRRVLTHAMKVLSRQFVMGPTIEAAVKRAQTYEQKGYRFSYDMLGEVAITEADADRYFQAYSAAIKVIGEASGNLGVIDGPGISVKLSALHPRYQYAQRERVLKELVPRVFTLARQAKAYELALTIDAEEADRLELSLAVIEAVISDPSLDGWDGLGIALQAYQKRAWYVIDWLVDLAQRTKHRLKIRLIKGAYWDTEIKEAQMQGFSGYPVFTRKEATDVSYIACAKKILSHPKELYPQFATHNALTVATMLALLGDKQDFEFQCLHGMGHALYDQIVGPEAMNIPCRVYAPVGHHEDLLPYLVRRILENGANNSFVNQIENTQVPVEALVKDPVATLKALPEKPHPKIPLPQAIFGEYRPNSPGIDLANKINLVALDRGLRTAVDKAWTVAPIVGGHEHFETGHQLLSPNDHRHKIGEVQFSNEAQVEAALTQAEQACDTWQHTPVFVRAEMLRKTAELFVKHRDEMLALLIREAGKTLADAVSEWREAIDFCYYYAASACEQMGAPIELPGYTGETNTLALQGRGVFVAISPWNFPLAIFTGQISAALVTGNTVIAKPAEQTPLIAGLVVRLMHAAGVPGDVLQLLPGKGSVIGPLLVADQRVSGVVFTGSTQTACDINRTLAAREGAIVPLIAETGGQNAMIVDSSALPEQVVLDVMTSAFGSAGQRCSALRVLCLQEDIADRVIELLKGAMAELTLGDPALVSTDIGPIIDSKQKIALRKYVDHLKTSATLIAALTLPEDCEQGTFFPPHAYLIESIKALTHEVFGPVLHVVKYKAKNIDQLIEDINQTGYGLTVGIHSRIDAFAHYCQQRLKVGNCYLNRNMIGAVVGVQPFGGDRLSGTGPKAGGPHYLPRFCTERTVTTNTAATGGNASLVMLA